MEKGDVEGERYNLQCHDNDYHRSLYEATPLNIGPFFQHYTSHSDLLEFGLNMDSL